MELEYTLNETDLITLAGFQMEHSPAVRRRLLKIRLELAIGFSLMAIGAYLVLDDPIYFMAVGLLAVLILVALPMVQRWQIKLSLPKRVRKQMTPAILARQRLRITSGGIERQIEEGNSSVAWSEVDGVVEIPDYALISVGGIPSIMIPRAQVGELTYRTFVGEVRERMHSEML